MDVGLHVPLEKRRHQMTLSSREYLQVTRGQSMLSDRKVARRGIEIGHASQAITRVSMVIYDQ